MNQLDGECEKFLGGPTVAYQERVHVTLNSRGMIFLNQKAHKMMGSPAAVYLYYNRVRDQIILEPAEAGASNAFLVRNFGANASGRCVRAAPFCKHFGIRVQGTVRFITADGDDDRRLYLNLSRTETVTHPKGRGPRKMKEKSRIDERM